MTLIVPKTHGVKVPWNRMILSLVIAVFLGITLKHLVRESTLATIIAVIKFEIKNKNNIIKEYMEASKYIEEPTSRAAFLNHYKIIKELEKRGYKEIYTGLGGSIISLERTTPNKFNWDQKPIVKIFRNKVIQRAVHLIYKMRKIGVRIPRRILIQILLGYISGREKIV